MERARNYIDLSQGQRQLSSSSETSLDSLKAEINITKVDMKINRMLERLENSPVPFSNSRIEYLGNLVIINSVENAASSTCLVDI